MIGHPYTHAEHARRCHDAAQLGHTLHAQHVQVMRRGVLYCAQICYAWTTPGGEEFWTVHALHPESGRFTVPYRQVRLCGEEGSCVCVGALDGACAPQAKRDAQAPSGARRD